MTERTWNLYLIVIHADKQGNDSGSNLISHVEAPLANVGHRILLVETSGNPVFEKTRRVYLESGCTQEARIQEFHATRDDKIVFWKKL